MDPLPIVVAFNVGEQVAPRGIAIGVFALVDKFGFQGAEEALHRRVIPAVCLAAHRWGDGGGLQDLAVIAGGVLTAAIRMMDQARPRAASLECHGEGGNGEFGAQMLAHRPADDLASEQVEDHGQVEPTFAGRDVGDIRQPDLIGPVGCEIPIQQVGGYRQGMLAVGRAYAIAAWRVSPDAVLAHQPLDPLAADGLALGTQLGMNTRCPISAAVLRMNPPDIDQQLAIGVLARALWLRTPSVEAGRRHAQGIAHDAHRPDIPVVLDQAEPHLGGSEKMATAFFKMSRSMRRRSFSRRSRAISAVRSGEDVDADVLECNAVPAPRPSLRLRQLRSIEGEMPSSPAICPNDRPLLASRATDSCLNSSGKMTPFLAHSTPFRSHRSLSKVSTNSGEAHSSLDLLNRTGRSL